MAVLVENKIDQSAVPDVPPCTLLLKGDRLHVRMNGATEEIPVKILFTRPLSERGDVILMDDKHREVVSLPGLHVLAPACQDLARQALGERYHMPRISRVHRVYANFGTRYWDVDTDRGRRAFALREPGKNVTWLKEDRIILRDTMGNRFEIPSLSALDLASRKEVLSVL